jgi:hypothetical protein
MYPGKAVTFGDYRVTFTLTEDNVLALMVSGKDASLDIGHQRPVYLNRGKVVGLKFTTNTKHKAPSEKELKELEKEMHSLLTSIFGQIKEGVEEEQREEENVCQHEHN